MATTVKQLRAESANFTLDLKSTTTLVKVGWETEWEVLYDPADWDDPSDLNAVIAGDRAGLPRVGGSVFYDEATGLMLPYVVATSKSVTRDSTNAYRFIVRVSYEQNEGDNNTPQGRPADPEDIETGITWSVRDSTTTAWTEDPSVSSPKKCLLPTNSMYAQAPTKEAGVFVAKVVQYENNFDFDDLVERYKACNEKKWGRFEAYGAKIENIEWKEVDVPVVGDVTIKSLLVTYTIACRELTIKNLLDAEDPESSSWYEDRVYGWEEPRVRADIYYNTEVDDPGTRKLAVPKNPGSAMEVYLKSDGTIHAAERQNGVPPYDFLRLQPEVDFGDFLRGS